MSKKFKRKSIKTEQENKNKLTKPRFVATFLGMLFGVIYLFVGVGMLLLVYDYESNGMSVYGLISPALFSIGVGLFQIIGFFLRKNKKLWKNCTLFSLVCVFGVAISFTIVYIGYLNPFGTFLGTLTFFFPIIICQILIMLTGIEFHKKELKEFNIERGKSRESKTDNE